MKIPKIIAGSTAITIASAFFMDSVGFQSALIWILSIILWFQMVVSSYLIIINAAHITGIQNLKKRMSVMWDVLTGIEKDIEEALSEGQDEEISPK